MQEILFKYVAQQTPEENKDILLETTKEMQYYSEGGKNAMTMAESLVEDGKKAGRIEGLKKGVKEGLKKGLKQGREESMRSVVRSMLKEGIDYELVQRVTGLTAEEIAALLADRKEK